MNKLKSLPLLPCSVPLLRRSLALILCLTTAGSSLGAATPSGARKDPNGVTWGELELLPAYCRDANGIVWGDASYNPSPRAGRWVALMGEDFWHIHHYCYALANLRRAELETNPTKKRFILGQVLGDYIYMIRNAAPSLIVMPEILVRTGDVHQQLGNVGDALMAYQTAMTNKPDYWPSYSRAAAMFAGTKNKKRALEFLERGLAQAPDSKELRQQYVALGGDPKKFASQAAPSRAAAPAPVATPAAPAASSGPSAVPVPRSEGQDGANPTAPAASSAS